ncbi:hypothetical protein EDM57_21115 [Brevibacillus gelatini]|uniref:Uncharacterized protein n=1 Tax=Brevibacillus gelatini TaxID=1655277 RepID=A0A3M8ANA2_9BACL|nr:LamG-like jellyroll fold domain-containing protein [Brevibacillus gelatini]RNB52690.1 hypothetical protein EDM57_21115 [Brevibacillus gelatini]
MALIGQPLTAPEPGWKRYDDTHAAIKRVGTWSVSTNSSHWNGTAFYSPNEGDQIIFYFKGTKIRFICQNSITYPDSVPVSIDGVTETFSIYHESTTGTFQNLEFEKIGLEDKIHTVVITVPSGGKNTHIDAIDIDEEGRLIHPDEVFNVSDLTVGKRIRCHYRASVSGQVGIFTDIGKENYVDGINDFIPTTSTAIADGDFYFIMVDDFNGQIKLIADRNLQHSLAWETLNLAGIASESGISLNGVFATKSSPKNYVVVDDKLKLRFVEDVTVNAKIKLHAYRDTGVILTYAGYGETNANNVLYQIGYTASGMLSLGHEYNAGSDQFFTTTYKIPLEEIVDITITRDSANKKYILYINGEYHSTIGYSYQPTTSESSTHKLCLGGNITAAAFPGMDVTYYGVSVDNRYVSPEEYADYAVNKWTGKPFTLDLIKGDEFFDYVLRLPSSGTNELYTDNEWDKYIVNSTLNGTITAGDNAVWNWKGVYSLTNTRNSSNNIIIRGNTGVQSLSTISSSSTLATSTGFRPLLVVIKKPKSLVYHQGEYKAFNNGSWNKISSILPTENTIRERGNKLSDYDRKEKTFSLEMSKASFGQGTKFSATVDFKKFFDIVRIEIE